MGNPGPDIRWVSVKEDAWGGWSAAVVDVLADDALETTEEFCAARRIVRSRVRRFTYVEQQVTLGMSWGFSILSISPLSLSYFYIKLYTPDY